MTATASYRPAKLAKWRPKRWEPVYEQMVILSCGMNKSNKEIGEMFGYTAQHVSNVLNTPEASLVRRRILETLKDKVDAGIPKRLDELADKAVQRLAQVLHNDDLFERSPFAVVDRAIATLRGVGRLKTQSEMDGAKNNTNVLILAGEDAADIRAGLILSKEARELHPVELPASAIKELKAS